MKMLFVFYVVGGVISSAICAYTAYKSECNNIYTYKDLAVRVMYLLGAFVFSWVMAVDFVIYCLKDKPVWWRKD